MYAMVNTTMEAKFFRQLVISQKHKLLSENPSRDGGEDVDCECGGCYGSTDVARTGWGIMDQDPSDTILINNPEYQS